MNSSETPRLSTAVSHPAQVVRHLSNKTAAGHRQSRAMRETSPLNSNEIPRTSYATPHLAATVIHTLPIPGSETVSLTTPVRDLTILQRGDKLPSIETAYPTLVPGQWRLVARYRLN